MKWGAMIEPTDAKSVRDDVPDLAPDAWERFEAAVDQVVKAPRKEQTDLAKRQEVSLASTKCGDRR